MSSFNTYGKVVGPPEGAATDGAKQSNPDVTPTEVELSDLDALQMLLDVIGLIPACGAPADIINGIISAARGDWLGAGLSVFGVIPVAGEAATIAKIVKNSEKYLQALKVVETKVLPNLPGPVRRQIEKALAAARKKIDELIGKKPDTPSSSNDTPETPDADGPPSGGQIKATKPNFGKPARRHDPCKTKGNDHTKDKNSMLDPDIDVNADLAKINSGDFVKQGDTIIVNGRTYGYHADTGTTFPMSGPGVIGVDRAQHQFLKKLNSQSFDDAMKFAQNFPGLDEAKIAQVLDLWRKCK